MGGLLSLALVGGAVLALGAVLLLLQRRSRRQAGGTSTLGPFLRHFEAEGVPPEVAAAVHRQLRSWMSAQDRHFAVRPRQDLASVYGLVPEEVRAAVDRLARECGRREGAPPGDAAPATVSDLVHAVARRPPREGDAPEAEGA